MSNLSAQAPVVFLPPEAFGPGGMFADGGAEQDPMFELSQASSWDVATRYHEFKTRKSYSHITERLREISAYAVLERAREVLGSVVHPVVRGSAPWLEVPAGAQQIEFDLDETLENAPLGVEGEHGDLENIWMGFEVRRSHPVVISVDTSLSMTGEKLALTAVALAVVLLQFPEDPVGIIAFENEARILKQPFERISVFQLVERFLDVPAQGYTHLEAGMKAALSLVDSATGPGGGSRKPSTVLVTDGKYTAGRDPVYLAPRFDHLVVLKMGRERSSLALCEEMASGGHGMLREVADLEALPQVMYGVVKDLLRGRS